MMDFLVGHSEFIQPVALWALFAITLLVFFFKKRIRVLLRDRVSIKRLAVLGVLIRIFCAGLFMYLQYYIWGQDTNSSYFLMAPLSETAPIYGIKYLLFFFGGVSGYFYFYSFSRFWLSAILSILSAFAFYGFLLLLKKRTGRFFDDGEVELGLLSALIVGWPMFVAFIPITFLCVIFISIIRLAFFKERYTTLGIPFILAVFITLILGSILSNIFGFSVLKV